MNRGGVARGRLGRSVVATAALAGLAASLLTACSAVRSDLGTTNGPCYVALPAASDAVHNQGHLDGVRLRSVAGVARDPGFRVLDGRLPTSGHVCMVAYSGLFHADAVEKGVGAPSGTLAVVVLGYPSKRLVATLVATRGDGQFGHTHIG